MPILNILMLKISIITATYNSESVIRETLESIFLQTYTEIETIIIDGLSTDSTLSIVNSFGTKIDSVISEKDHGIYDALNKGVKISNGDIIGFLHSGNLFYDQEVVFDIAKCFENPNVHAVYGNLVYVQKNNISRIVRQWKSENFHSDLLKRGWMPPHPTLYVRRSIFNELNFFDLSFKISSDYDFIVRLFSNEKLSFKYIPRILVKMRTGGISNNSINSIYLKSFEDLKIIKKNSIGGLGVLLRKNFSKIFQFWGMN